ncbi:MAG: hypothetical protein EA425_03095 [Puniceicoccaceae bacterium]|nr:MAG: hypothetical protein EA425_03095 [Puniceicoccaceae bacterium]
MSLLDRLERLCRPVALPHLTLILVLGQVLVWGLSLVEAIDLNQLRLVPLLVLEGEIWRLLTFFFVPPAVHPVFLAFAWYIFYLMGSTLESEWGIPRYNLFLFLGAAATIAASFLAPATAASNAFLAGSVFLAFAWLYPNFELALFLILPVKVKWLAWLTIAIYALQLIFGPPAVQAMVVAASFNVVLFFGREMARELRNRRRQSVRRAEREADAMQPRHRCTTCGRSDLSHPELEFRYCSKCGGTHAYCEDHLRNHEHVVPERAERRR